MDSAYTNIISKIDKIHTLKDDIANLNKSRQENLAEAILKEEQYQVLIKKLLDNYTNEINDFCRILIQIGVNNSHYEAVHFMVSNYRFDGKSLGIILNSPDKGMVSVAFSAINSHMLVEAYYYVDKPCKFIDFEMGKVLEKCTNISESYVDKFIAKIYRYDFKWSSRIIEMINFTDIDPAEMSDDLKNSPQYIKYLLTSKYGAVIEKGHAIINLSNEKLINKLIN